MEIVAVILAGGKGTRIGHLLGDLPKPMMPVLGRPFLEWVVDYLRSQGVERVVISTGYRGEAIEAHFSGNTSIRCVREEGALGTAGGFCHAVSHAGDWKPDAWLVLNGDSLVLASLKPLFALLDEPIVDGALLGVEVPDASRFGTLDLNSTGELAGFHEKRPGQGVINGGVYLLRRTLEFPAARPLSFEVDVFPRWIASGKHLKAHACRAPFIDIGTPDSLAGAEEFLRDNGNFFK